MRPLTSLLLIFFITTVHAQSQVPVAKFDNSFKLKDGIYTSYVELLMNNPAFPDCIIIIHADKNVVNTDALSYCSIGNEGNAMPFNSTLYATVLNGKLTVYYDKSLVSVYSKGTLCTFIYTTDSYKNQRYNSNFYQPAFGPPPAPGDARQKSTLKRSNFKSNVFVLDIETGEIYKLTKYNISKSIARDSILYEKFIKVKPGKKNKNLFKFIAEFNTRNPTYLPVKDTAIVSEEE